MLKIKKSEFYHRLLFAIVAISVAGLLVTLAYHPWVNVLLVLTVAVLTGIGVWEYARLAHNKGMEPATKMMIVVAILEVLAFYTALTYPAWSKFALLIIVFGFISFFVAHFKNAENALLHVAVEFFGVCYLAIPFSFMLAILYPKPEVEDGRWWLFYLLAVTKVTDIGGYFIGKLFGRHPLAPQLSPKKTIEGALGGFVCAIILSFVFAKMGMGGRLSYFNAAWLGMMIGVLAQLGDLAESVLKRDASVKDSNAFPGIGGILDMVDSLLFTSPVVYFFIRSM